MYVCTANTFAHVMYNIFAAPFTTAEIVWLKTVRNLTERVEDADTDTDLLLTYEEVKKVVLRRVREVDVSAVYRTLRSWLPLYYAVLIVLGLLFYMFYGESDSWSAALNYALSSWYALHKLSFIDKTFTYMHDIHFIHT